MKTTCLLALFMLISVFSSFGQGKTENYLIISGAIKNPNSDTISILDSKQKPIFFIHLKPDNTFRDTVYLAKGYYRLNDGKEETLVYLKPDYNLNISLNTKEFDESIIYKGVGADENNYLAEKTLLLESFGKLRYYGYYAKLNENDFLNLTDSLYDLQTQLLNGYKNLEKDFVFLESKSLELNKLYKYARFERMKRFVTGDKDFTVSENYPNSFASVDLSTEELLLVPGYLEYIRIYLTKIARKNKTEGQDHYLEYIKTIDQQVENPKIKSELAYYVGKWFLGYTKKLDSVYNKVKPLLTNNEQLSEVTEIYKTLKRTEKGAVSPPFSLKDINGETVSLNDLKGKLVYIDVWATWCLPCIKEIPDLKKAQEYFKGKEIQFVSICKSDTKERWKKMVLEKQLGGIQLFAPDEGVAFFKDYYIQGIPRFILIDREGKIIDARAKRPSDPELIMEIEKYL